MTMRHTLRLLLLFGALHSLHAQDAWQSTPAFPLPASPLSISRTAHPHNPFTVAGEAGAIFGQGDGTFEAWAFPVKIASHFRITAELAGYPVPIELNEYAAAIDVHPDHTTITYSHAAFTVKQHMFSGRGESATGPVVFFEIASVRPLTLTFRFTPDMLRMWPAPNFGLPSAEWVQKEASGYYILHTDNETLLGAVGIPGALPGILAPYQERPRTYPLELKLPFDPKTQSGKFFPLLMTAGASSSEVAAKLLAMQADWPRQYQRTSEYYAHFFDNRLLVESPDAAFNLAMRWAELAIDQAQVRFHIETGLIAGYYSSADSARPGFGWFFGRDTLFTLYAAHSYGDFALSRRALEFLLNRQRADGKIMHEFSQTADLVDWKATPYFYAAADSTPLLLMTAWDYIRGSGDVAFLRQHWAELKRAWAFTRAHDSDGDGIYENTEGTGWVESWPTGMPHQEIYLAALDQQSCTAMAKLAETMREPALAASASAQARRIEAALAPEYFDGARKFYAFSRNADGSTDRTATSFPSIAWWDGTLQLANADSMFERWASAEFSTDWGVRDVSRAESVYDPISYHQGSVWPLYTGWLALAEYRAGRPFAGYAHLMQNARMTFTQDLGAVTELLSGDFFQPFGRSSSHQLWSSAMVVTPAVRGLFGVEPDAPRHTLRVRPQLPVTWDSASLRHVRVGLDSFDLTFRRENGRMIVEASSAAPQQLCLTSGPDCTPVQARTHRLEVALPAFEIGLPAEIPAPGAATTGPKLLAQSDDGFELEGLGGTVARVDVRFGRRPAKIDGATLENGRLLVRFPGDVSYHRMQVRFSW